MSPDFELVLLTLERDLGILAIGMPYIRKFIAPAKVTFLASASCLQRIAAMGISIAEDTLLDEDRAVPGLTLDGVRTHIQGRGADPGRVGWYFKQLLILAYALRAETWPRYLVWDSDSVPLRPMTFVDAEGRTFHTLKTERHEPYFDTIRKLLGLESQVEGSFIAEHTIFDRELVRSMLTRMMGGRAPDGANVSKRILECVTDEDLSSAGFSEYETYGTYASAIARDRIVLRHLPSSRFGTDSFGRSPSPANLFALSTRFHWATFESWPGKKSGLMNIKRMIRRMRSAGWSVFSALTHPLAYKRFKIQTS